MATFVFPGEHVVQSHCELEEKDDMIFLDILVCQENSSGRRRERASRLSLLAAMMGLEN